MRNLIPFLLLLTIIGCSTENPLCTDNYCVTGELFPRSELDDNVDFSEIAIDDSQIIAALTGVTPVQPTTQETTPVQDSVTLADIVSDVANNGTTYLEQTVTITATVRFKLTSGSITLVTNNNNISFFVTAYDNPDSLNDYKKGETYTFTLFIRSIDFDTRRDNIWSNETD